MPGKDDPKAGISIFDKWEQQTMTNLELHLNFDTLEVYKSKVEFMPATAVQNGQPFELEVAVRGRFRRRTCEMPPLKLKFSKKYLRANGFNTHNDFKLVTHCMDGSNGQEALLREHLAYKLYNVINPRASFRTQLLTITYVNTVDGSTETSYGILIEDSDELQERTGLDNCKDCYNAPLAQYNNAELVTLFHYMIGNGDFKFSVMHNTKLLRGGDGQLTAVPYDFDFAGIVNADYIEQRPRELVWHFAETPELSAAAEYLISLEAELFQTIADFDELDKKGQRQVTNYLQDFFKDVRKMRQAR